MRFWPEKWAEHAKARGLPLHYGLVGLPPDYCGLMVWHGGLSGSAPIKVAEPGHLADLAAIADIAPGVLPEALPLGLTVFSFHNFVMTGGP